jgi:hypothetical protein
MSAAGVTSSLGEDPTSQPRGGSDDGQGSDGSSVVDGYALLTKTALRRAVADIHRSADKRNFAYTRLDMQGQNIKHIEGDLAAYPYVHREGGAGGGM